MSRSVPATGEGISVSTLSVETSSSGSSTATSSPTDFSQRVTVPSVTDSPRAGSVTDVPEPPPSDEDAAGFSVSGSVSPGGSSPFSSTTSCSCSAFFSAFSSSFGCASGVACSVASASPEPASPPDSPSSPTTASTAPTSTVSSSLALISSRVPATGEGISVSTLSVDTKIPSPRSEEHTSELQSRLHLVCRLLLEKKKKNKRYEMYKNRQC